MLTRLAMGIALSACTATEATGDSGTDTFDDATLDLALCEAGNGPFSSTIDNAYLPFVVGSKHVLEGLEGGTEPASFQIEVVDETLDLGGVTAQVVEKRAVDGDQVGRPEREFYAQAADGTVCLFGADEDDDGEADWEAGKEGWKAGIFMPAVPEVGMKYEQIHGPEGVEAAEITFVGEPTETPAGTFDDTVTALEDGPSLKKYARDIGEIYDDGVALISY